LADGHDVGVVVDNDGARTRSALIEREDVWHYSGSETLVRQIGRVAILLKSGQP
jgi:hypothetical protein